MKTTVSIVGRTNVGKSSIFNKLAKSKSAIVSDREGLTRDLKTTELTLGNKSLTLVDTGGFFTSKNDEFEEMILAKAHEAIEMSELILFVVDKKFGISPYDKEIASILRKGSKQVILVINKIDVKTDEGVSVFQELGFEKIIEVSAEHNKNIIELKKTIFENVSDVESEEHFHAPKICIIGKPNVGKSSTINAISGNAKTIVSDIPGTTIDSIDVKIKYKKKDYIFVDTAGIRKKSKTVLKEEKFSIVKSLEAIKKSDLSILMLDAKKPFLDQDKKLLEKAREVGKAIVIAINKSDLINEKERSEIEINFQSEPMMRYLPVSFISAKDKIGFKHLFDQIYRVLENTDKRLSTNKLNNLLRKAVTEKSIPFKGKFKPKIRFVHQGGKNPHVLTIHGNSLDKLEGSYKRYLINTFQKGLNLLGVTLKLKFVTTKNPFN